MKSIFAGLIVLFVLCLTPLCRADEAHLAKVPPKKARPESAVVVKAEGKLLRVRPTSDEPWREPTVGERLPITVELRVGLRSAIEVRIGEKTLRCDRLGTYSIERQLVHLASTSAPFLRARNEIKPGGAVHESVMLSPSKTLSVGSRPIDNDVKAELIDTRADWFRLKIDRPWVNQPDAWNNHLGLETSPTGKTHPVHEVAPPPDDKSENEAGFCIRRVKLRPTALTVGVPIAPVKLF